MGVGEWAAQHPPWEALRYLGSGSGPPDALGFQLFIKGILKLLRVTQVNFIWNFYPAAPDAPLPPPLPGCWVDVGQICGESGLGAPDFWLSTACLLL